MPPTEPSPEERLERWLDDQLAGDEEDALMAEPAAPLSTAEVSRILRKARGELPVGQPPSLLPKEIPTPTAPPANPAQPGNGNGNGTRRAVSTFDRLHHAARVLLVAACLLLMLAGMAMMGEKLQILVFGPQGVVRKIEVAPNERIEIRRNGEVIDQTSPQIATIPLDPTLEQAARIVDDGDPDYHETGTGWRLSSLPGGFQAKHRYNNQGALSAFWTFPNLPAGRYDVYATWVSHPNRAFEAPYILHDGDRIAATVVVDQSHPPVGLLAKGTLWQRLGTFRLNGPKLVVELDSTRAKIRNDVAAGNSASADAVMVVPAKETPTP